MVPDIFLLKAAPLTVGAFFFGPTGVFAAAALGATGTGAAFFRFAHDAFIAADIFDLNSASSGGAMMAASFFEIFGAAASAFAALIAAHRLRTPSRMALRPAALILRFFGAGAGFGAAATFTFGLTHCGMVGSSYTSTNFGDEP